MPDPYGDRPEDSQLDRKLKHRLLVKTPELSQATGSLEQSEEQAVRLADT